MNNIVEFLTEFNANNIRYFILFICILFLTCFNIVKSVVVWVMFGLLLTGFVWSFFEIILPFFIEGR